MMTERGPHRAGSLADGSKAPVEFHHDVFHVDAVNVVSVVRNKVGLGNSSCELCVLDFRRQPRSLQEMRQPSAPYST